MTVITIKAKILFLLFLCLQISEIHSKYNELEKDLLVNRQKTDNLIVEYMEREVGSKLTELNNILLLHDGIFENEHQVSYIMMLSRKK